MRTVIQDLSSPRRTAAIAWLGMSLALASPAFAIQDPAADQEDAQPVESPIELIDIVVAPDLEDDPIAALLRAESAASPTPDLAAPIELEPTDSGLKNTEASIEAEPDGDIFIPDDDATTEIVSEESVVEQIVDPALDQAPDQATAIDAPIAVQEIAVQEDVAPVSQPSITPYEEPPFTRPVLAENKAAPPMWRLVDGDSEVWLLGTFHILPPDLDWRSNPLARAADAAEVIYFEAEVDTGAAQQKTLKILMTEGFNPKGVTLSGMLEEPHAQKLQDVVTELKLPMAAIDPMRPWQAFLTLSVQFIVNQGFDPGSGVETILIKEARARGRELRFFETIEQQIGFFTTLSPEAEKNLLVMTLAEWGAQQEQFTALFEAWRHGDAAALDLMMNQQMAQQAPGVYETLIVKRNQAWAEQVAIEMGNSNKVLVAVGAAHLVGEDSLPALLREKGFEVERFGVAE